MKTIEMNYELLKDKFLTASEKSSGQKEALWKLARRENIEKPVIYVGCGTCGLGAGANSTLKAIHSYLSKQNIDAEVVEVGCVGLCAVEPIMDVQIKDKNRVSFKHITEDKVEPILDSIFYGQIKNDFCLGQYINGNDSSHTWKDIANIHEDPFFAPQKRLVLKNCGLINPVSLKEYIASGGYEALLKALQTMTRKEVVKEVEKSGLRGRGGGGFLTGMKWNFALQEKSSQKYLICNADEGDPGAFMDRAVIEGDPFLLIEGMTIAAYAIGASEAYVYIRAEYPLAIERLKKALELAKKYQLLGKNILNSSFDLEIKIKMGAGAFVCGEETALIHSIEGKRGMPRPRPPYPTTSGLFGKPTVINNVETLSNIPTIISKGAAWMNNIGTPKSKGTKVFALSGKIKYTGLVEIPMGTSIRDIVFKIGGGIVNDEEFKAVQIGGPSGGCITEENLDIQVDYESLISVGAMMGSGGLVVMDKNTCMVDVAKFFMDFIQRESCGKCIPCREGTRRMLEILESITKKPIMKTEKDQLERFKGVLMLEKLAAVIKDTSLCGLGNSAPNPVLSTLKWFKEEYEEHIFNRKCPAGQCTELRSFFIDAEKCTGCTLCSKKCPTQAILGSRKNPHYIIEDKCIGCGTCEEVCKFEAVYIK